MKRRVPFAATALLSKLEPEYRLDGTLRYKPVVEQTDGKGVPLSRKERRRIWKLVAKAAKHNPGSQTK